MLRALDHMAPGVLPTDVEAALLIEVEALEEGIDRAIAVVVSASRRPAAARARRAAPQEIEIAWNARRSAYGALGRMHADSYTHDFATPRDQLVSSLRAAAEIATRHGLTLSSVAHLGDGNLHPRLHYDAREPGAFERALAASEELLVMVLDERRHADRRARHRAREAARARPSVRRGRARRHAPRQGRARPGRRAQSGQAPARGRRRLRAGGCTPMSPELRAGNASLRAGGDETLAAVQLAAAAAGQFLPVDADGAMTVSELLQRRDGGPIEARYGRLRDRVLAAGIGGLSLGSEAVKDVAGYDLRRMLLGSAPVEWAVFRLARLPERRERLLARGGDAFALAEALRADPAEPAALVVLEPGLLAIAEDCGADEQARRREHVERCARAGGRRARDARRRRAGWPLCAGLPSGAVRMASRDAASRAARRTRDLGRTTPVAAWPSSAPLPARRSCPARSAKPASAELVAGVLAAVGA